MPDADPTGGESTFQTLTRRSTDMTVEFDPETQPGAAAQVTLLGLISRIQALEGALSRERLTGRQLGEESTRDDVEIDRLNRQVSRDIEEFARLAGDFDRLHAILFQDNPRGDSVDRVVRETFWDDLIGLWETARQIINSNRGVGISLVPPTIPTTPQ